MGIFLLHQFCILCSARSCLAQVACSVRLISTKDTPELMAACRGECWNGWREWVIHVVQVLRAVGLKCEVSRCTFVEIAQHIAAFWAAAAQGQDPELSCTEIWQTALEAAKYLNSHAGSLHGEETYSQLREIAFVPARKVPRLADGKVHQSQLP